MTAPDFAVMQTVDGHRSSLQRKQLSSVDVVPSARGRNASVRPGIAPLGDHATSD